MSITELVQSAGFVAALMLLAFMGYGIFIHMFISCPEAVKMLELLELWYER